MAPLSQLSINLITLVISESLSKVFKTLKWLHNVKEVLDVVLHGDAWLINEIYLLVWSLLAKDHMACQQCRVCRHLHSAELANMLESLPEVLSPVLRWMVTKNASKDHESKRLSLSWLQHLLCTHVHEADVAEVTCNLAL